MPAPRDARGSKRHSVHVILEREHDAGDGFQTGLLLLLLLLSAVGAGAALRRQMKYIEISIMFSAACAEVLSLLSTDRLSDRVCQHSRHAVRAPDRHPTDCLIPPEERERVRNRARNRKRMRTRERGRSTQQWCGAAVAEALAFRSCSSLLPLCSAIDVRCLCPVQRCMHHSTTVSVTATATGTSAAGTPQELCDALAR